MPKRGKCISFDYGRTRRQRSIFAALLFIVAAPNHSTAKTKAIIQIVSAAELIMNYGSFYFAGWSTLNAKALSNLFHALLVSFDHLLDHLSADRTGLAGGQIAVVALLEVHADLPWCTPNILKSPFAHVLHCEKGERCPAQRNVKQAPLWCIGRIRLG